MQKHERSPKTSVATPCGAATNGSRWTAVKNIDMPRSSTLVCSLHTAADSRLYVESPTP